MRQDYLKTSYWCHKYFPSERSLTREIYRVMRYSCLILKTCEDNLSHICHDFTDEVSWKCQQTCPCIYIIPALLIGIYHVPGAMYLDVLLFISVFNKLFFLIFSFSFLNETNLPSNYLFISIFVVLTYVECRFEPLEVLFGRCTWRSGEW